MTKFTKNHNIHTLIQRTHMDIQTITDEIRHKLTHLVNVKVPSFSKTIENQSEEEKESQVSLFITDLTFQVSNKVIKEKISKMNPKPLEFTFYINRAKYFEQTVNELVKQIQEGVYFDAEEIKTQQAKFANQEPFAISFKGHFLKDYGYMGHKTISHKDEINNDWFPAILSCLKVKEEDPQAAKEMLDFIQKFVLFGFKKALDMEYVFVEQVKMDENLLSVDYIQVKDKKMTTDEFIQFREANLIGKKK